MPNRAPRTLTFASRASSIRIQVATFTCASLVAAVASAATVPPATGTAQGRGLLDDKRAPVAAPRLDAGRLSSARLETGRDGKSAYRVQLDGGAAAELTLDPRLQKMAESVLASHKRPYAAAVMVNVDDGRVLAMAGSSRSEPEKSGASLCLSPWAPAASVFKLVTAAALVDAGVSPETQQCFHGGTHSVEAGNLVDSPRLDDACRSFAFGMARSQNAIIARLANDHLGPTMLESFARALGFGASLGSDFALIPSEARVPSEPLDFARVAAGFWHTTLSPLHGAWLAATIARGGIAPALHLVARIFDGQRSAVPEMPGNERVLDEKTARAVGKMMVGTTEFGTALHAFHDGRGRPYLHGIKVAGKTGTLSRKSPYLGYSWFVGFAPAVHPTVAVAVLIGNPWETRVRASKVAREILEGYFHGGGRPLVAQR